MLTIPSRSMIDGRLASWLPVTERHIPGSGSFICGDLVRHIIRETPLCYLRWSHGEFTSMMPGRRRQRQADKHDYFYDTLGEELRCVLDEAAVAACGGDNVRIEINGTWSVWAGMHEVVASIPPLLAPHIVVDAFWPEAVRNGDIFRLWDAMSASQMPRVLVGTESHRILADAIGATLVVTPPRNVWLSIDEVESNVRQACAGRAVILLCGIGMASGCLLWRLWDKRSIMVDSGHVCDAMIGRRNRRYIRAAGRYTYWRAFKQWLRNRDEK